MTRLFGVIGHPIRHSLSPVMHTAALQALRLDAIYAPLDVPPRFLAPMLRGLILAGVEGLNVTVPLKEAIIPLLDRVETSARAIGAVNTVVVRNRRAIGYNTDGTGCARALQELGWSHHLRQPPPTGGALRNAQGLSGQRQVVGWRVRPGRVVILGAGGAARAVAWAVARMPGGAVVIANRHVERARRLARWLKRLQPRLQVQAVALARLDVSGADLVVNATTVGMRPGDDTPVDLSRLPRRALVYDLIYHRETALVRAARRRGCVAANGVSMLLYQGAESLRLWLHREPPIDVMRRALRGASRSKR